MSLQSLQCGIFIAPVVSCALERVYVGDSVQWSCLGERRDVVRRGLDGDVSHGGNLVQTERV